jgi:[protein-PII] uridylyltransferase
VSLLRPVSPLPVEPRISQAAEMLQDLQFPEQRLEGLGILRQFVRDATLDISHAHLAGASGVMTARQLASVIDQVIVESYQFLRRSPLFSRPRRCPQVAIVAVGGYGRGDLNPLSDLDIVVLHPPQDDDINTQFMIQFTYFLMDMRLDVHYSNRSVANCVQMARHDLSTKTSFLEAHPLVGDAQLLEQFHRTVQREWLGKGADRFIQAKADERRRRHAKYHGSVSVLEPNVKESPGGLRDYHTALWVGAVRVGARSFEALEATGVITAVERRAVAHAYDFLLRVRTDLHFAQQWKNDVLAIEVQAGTASRLGYGEHGTGLPVERFMREYYRQAREIYHLCASVLNRCRPHERGIGKVLEYMLRKELDHGFVVARGEITVKERGKDPFPARPTLLLEVFALALPMAVGLSEDLKALIRAHLELIDDAFRADPQHSRLFMSILKHPHAARTLRAMHEVGVLSAYLPEFEPITGLVHHDLYHKYTVDEHTLRAVDYLDELPETAEK